METAKTNLAEILVHFSHCKWKIRSSALWDSYSTQGTQACCILNNLAYVVVLHMLKILKVCTLCMLITEIVQVAWWHAVPKYLFSLKYA